MNINDNVIRADEKAIFNLRSLYQRYGYTGFKMSKFEHYDLYLENKDFLVSDNIITFNDTDGSLMALKPDVTLSIIKNTDDCPDSVEKVYYNENVYRVSKGTQSFKEIMQAGLECIGNVDDYCIYEVIMLAAESLKNISDDYVLDISHMGIVSYVTDSMNLSDKGKKELLNCIADKNISECKEICRRENADSSPAEALIRSYGSLKSVCKMLSELGCKNETEQLKRIVGSLEDNGYKVRVDFSVINDMKYYNGFVFKGFVNSIPASILSGGQYDNMMKKMRKRSKAIGFAVYLDMLERFGETENRYDVDAVILYDDDYDLNALNNAVSFMTAGGKSVTVRRTKPEGLRYKQLLKLNGKGVEIVENNA